MPKNQKRPNSVGYYSAYYRGLEVLLDMWPKIREQVPDTTLDIYYGWESWLAIQGEDDLYLRICAKLEALKDEGVTEHGRVSHTELAKAMLNTQVWAYPTSFPEIHCITALKAQEAGMWPVVTGVAALNETVKQGDIIDSHAIGKDGYKQDKFIKAVVKALKEKKTAEPVPDTDWSDVAKQWAKEL